MYFISVILGLIAGFLWLVSFTVKNKKFMLTISVIENIVYTLQYFILAYFCSVHDAYTIMAIDVINIFRTICFMQKGTNEFTKTLFIPITFSLIYIISLVFTYSTYISIFGTLASVILIVGLWTDKLSTRRIFCILNIIIWIISDFLMTNYVNLITYSIVLISTITVTIREIKNGTYQKENLQSLQNS